MNTDLRRQAALLPRWVTGIALALALALATAGCDTSAPPHGDFPPFDFSYLTRLRLNVATIDIDDSWQAPPDGRQIGAYAPVSPIAALHQMGIDRLAAGGGSGRAVFTIVDASLLRSRRRIDGSFAVRLAVNNTEGTRSAYAEARVARSSTLADDDPATLRAALYTLVKQAMDDMNVEFEYQARRSLRDWLQATASSAPLPPPVQSQDLPPPGAVQASPPFPSTDTVPIAPRSPSPYSPPAYASPPAHDAPPAYASPPGSPQPRVSFGPTPLAPPTYAPPPAYIPPPRQPISNQNDDAE